MSQVIAGFCRLQAQHYHQHGRHIRVLSTFTALHNRWSKIGREKTKVDSAKSKQSGVLSQHISHASKTHGPDPKANAQLAALIANAKSSGMPKTSIDTAILRGQGRSSSGAALETVIIEAVVPPVALIIEAETDKKLQTLQEIRSMLKAHRGMATPTAYLFEKRGRITLVPKEGTGIDEVLDSALELGALDVDEDADGNLIVDADPATLKVIEAALTGRLGLAVETSETVWHPNPDTVVQEMQDDSLEQVEKLTESLERYPGVEGVYTNIALS